MKKILITGGNLITYVTDRAGHDLRYGIDSSQHTDVTSGNYQAYYNEQYTI